MSTIITRRGLLRAGALSFGAVAGSTLLAACGGAATGQVTTASSAAPAAVPTAAVASTSSQATSSAAASSTAASSVVSGAATSTSATSAAVTTVAATTSAASKPAAAGGGKTAMQFWTALDDPISQGLLTPWVTKFNQQNPDLSVTMSIVAGDSNFEKYTNAFVAGTPPDAVLTTSFPIAVEWAASQLIQPMDAWAKQLGAQQSDFYPWVWDMQYFHGKLWCLLQEYDTNIFVWNKTLFQKAGLDPNKPPTTISDLDDMADHLTHQTGSTFDQVGHVPWKAPAFSDWVAVYGGNLFDAKQGRWTLNTPQAEQVLTWYQQYLNKLGGLSAVNAFWKQFTSKNSPLGSGKVAMQVVGDWVPLTSYNIDSPSLDYGVGALPVASGVAPGTNTVIGSDTFVLPVGVKNPEASMRFMLYMDSTDPALAWCVAEANVPPKPVMANDPKFAKGLSYGKLLVDMAKPELLQAYPVSPINSDAIGFLNAAVTNVENGKATPAQALAEAQSLTDQKQKDFSAKRPGW
jgi:multiple sugar transport system substrate-binding protein